MLRVDWWCNAQVEVVDAVEVKRRVWQARVVLVNREATSRACACLGEAVVWFDTVKGRRDEE